MRKIIAAIASFLILILIMTGLIMRFKPHTSVKNNERIQIIATLFPQYDFAKHIAGDKADVILLLNSGVETHNYEPTAKDMTNLLNTDMFVSTGTMLEPWTEKIIDSLNDNNVKIVDTSKNIKLITIEEFEKQNLNSEIINDEEEHSHEEEHQEIYDEHIWQSPINATIMIDDILESLCEIDPENSDYYKNNANEYKNEIKELDSQIRNIVNNASRKEVAIGGEFAYAYFIQEYGLKFVSVYNNCGEGEDPSVAKVKSIIDYINNHKLKVIYYQELTEGSIAKMISDETSTESLIWYSIHNGNPQTDSYVSLMKKNIENLKKGLE